MISTVADATASVCLARTVGCTHGYIDAAAHAAKLSPTPL